MDKPSYDELLEKLFNQFPVYQKIGSRAFKVGLGNSEAISEHLCHPHRAYRTIHVAGTNGKGSTSHSLAAVLQAAGYRTGLYTSPHLVDFRERIRVDGQMIERDEVVDFITSHNDFLAALQPSFFETTMSMAFDHFRRHAVDVAVIEVGLGGRMDSTNIISPDLSVITNIGLDHTAFLGNTKAEIAAEKAGIIKPGTPVVIGERDAETDGVFVAKALECDAPIVFAQDVYSLSSVAAGGDFTDMVLTGAAEQHRIRFSLTGLCQQRNIVTIMAAISQLRSIGYNIPDEAIVQGLSDVQGLTGLMGRWQRISANPDVITDTGHNAHGIRLVAEQLRCSRYENKHIVIGMVNDKHPEEVLPLLPPDAKYYFTQASIERAMPAEQLAAIAREAGIEGEVYPTVKKAVEAAKKNAGANDLIFIGGSNFVVAEVL